MKRIAHGARSRDRVLHIEADGVLINIEIGLADVEGHRVTAISVSPDDASRGGDGEGRLWVVADANEYGMRLVRLHEGETELPALDG